MREPHDAGRLTDCEGGKFSAHLCVFCLPPRLNLPENAGAQIEPEAALIQQDRDDPPPGPGVVSTRKEEKRVEERVAINAHVVYETIRREGEEELARSNAALTWSALAAGLSMGISLSRRRC